MQENVVKIAESTPSFNVKYLSQKRVYRIKYKYKGRYATGEDCFNQLKFIYETMKLSKIDWSYFVVDIFEKHIEISSSYKFV